LHRINIDLNDLKSTAVPLRFPKLKVPLEATSDHDQDVRLLYCSSQNGVDINRSETQIQWMAYRQEATRETRTKDRHAVSLSEFQKRHAAPRHPHTATGDKDWPLSLSQQSYGCLDI
jgi:hypothetical protein